jgi:hypothetical protein
MKRGHNFGVVYVTQGTQDEEITTLKKKTLPKLDRNVDVSVNIFY